jgi:hypothetical protein
MSRDAGSERRAGAVDPHALMRHVLRVVEYQYQFVSHGHFLHLDHDREMLIVLAASFYPDRPSSGLARELHEEFARRAMDVRPGEVDDEIDKLAWFAERCYASRGPQTGMPPCSQAGTAEERHRVRMERLMTPC